MPGVGPCSYLSAQSDSAIEVSRCTPWKCCRIYGLDFPTFSTIAGLRQAEVGRHLAAAKPACTCIYIRTCAAAHGQATSALCASITMPAAACATYHPVRRAESTWIPGGYLSRGDEQELMRLLPRIYLIQWTSTGVLVWYDYRVIPKISQSTEPLRYTRYFTCTYSSMVCF